MTTRDLFSNSRSNAQRPNCPSSCVRMHKDAPASCLHLTHSHHFGLLAMMRICLSLLNLICSSVLSQSILLSLQRLFSIQFWEAIPATKSRQENLGALHGPPTCTAKECSNPYFALSKIQHQWQQQSAIESYAQHCYCISHCTPESKLKHTTSYEALHISCKLGFKCENYARKKKAENWAQQEKRLEALEEDLPSHGLRRLGSSVARCQTG